MSEQNIGQKADIEIFFNDAWDDDAESKKFFDILGYKIGGGVLAIIFDNGQTLIYNMDRVKEIRHQVKE